MSVDLSHSPLNMRASLRQTRSVQDGPRGKEVVSVYQMSRYVDTVNSIIGDSRVLPSLWLKRGSVAVVAVVLPPSRGRVRYSHHYSDLPSCTRQVSWSLISNAFAASESYPNF